MKKTIIAALFATIASSAFAGGWLSDKDGTQIRKENGTCEREMGVRRDFVANDCRTNLLQLSEDMYYNDDEAETPSNASWSGYRTRSIKGDIRFDTGRSKPQKSSERIMNAVVAASDTIDVEKTEIVGHTDRFGSDKSNMKLSKKRAETVEQRVSKMGMEDDYMEVSWKGERAPTTGHECDNMSFGKTVKCLQPDRHVEIRTYGVVKETHR